MSRHQINSIARSARPWTVSSRAASTSAETWTRPLAAGVNSAYDAALDLLETHSQQLLKRADELRSQTGKTDAETASLQRRVKQLEVEARLTDPKLRAKFESTQGASEDVEDGEADALRTLAERQWKRHGRLDRLVRRECMSGCQPLIVALQMQRVIQMNVIPDVVPRFTPTIDLAVSFGESPAATGGEPGAYLLPSQVCLVCLSRLRFRLTAVCYVDDTTTKHQAASV